MSFSPDEWDNLVSGWGASQSRFTTGAPTDNAGGGRMVATRENEPGRVSRFLSGAADAFRAAVPEPVRDVTGKGLRLATSGERFWNAVLPGDPATAVRHQVERVPVVGDMLGEGFDIALAPVTLLTAGRGAALGATLRGYGVGGRIAAGLISPASRSANPLVRLFSEAVMGTAATEAGNKAIEEDVPAPVALALSALAGGAAGAGLNIGRNAFTGRGAAQIAGNTFTDNRTFVRNPLTAQEVLGELHGPGSEFEASKVGRALNRFVDPSKNLDTDVAKAINVFDRQTERGNLLTEAAVGGVLDSKSKGTGLSFGVGGSVLNIDDATGRITNIVPRRPGLPTEWQDVLENRNALRDYNMAPDAQALIKDFHQALDETTDLLTSHGIPVPKNLTKDLIHVTRNVDSIRDIDEIARSNSTLARVYETIAEGRAAGIDYSNDPRATLGAMVQAAYKSIAQKQMDELLAPHVVTAKTVLAKTNPQVITDLKTAVSNLYKTRTAVRQERRAFIQANPPQPFTAGSISSEIGKPLSSSMANELTANKAAYEVARKRYASAMERTRKSSVLPGYIFGNQAQDVAVGTWKGKFLERDADYAKLAEKMDVLTGRPQPVKLDPFSKGMQGVADVVRLASATGDAAAPFVNGLPLLGQNPLLWAKAASMQYKGMLDPSSVGRYVQQHLESVQEMARHGVPIGDVETYLAATQGTGLATPIHRFAGTGAGKQSLGRLEAGYDGFITAARVEMWDALKPVWDGSTEDLATYVRDATGALSSRSLGVGAHQRAIESVWLGFSPRLMRSTLALVAHAANPDSVAGQQAARSLLGLAAAGSLMAIGTNVGLGALKGENPDQVWARVEDTLNPTTGKFMSVDIGGQRLGVGGQVRAVTQFVAKAMANPSGFATANAFENPLINFYMGRGSVGVNVAGSLIEGVTGEKVNVLPYTSIDNLPDAALHLGSSLLPFVVQSQFQARDLSNFDRFTAAITSFAGANTTEKSPIDRINEEAMARWQKPYSELTGVEQQEIERDRADLFALKADRAAEFGGREARQEAAHIKTIDNERLGGERSLVDAFNRGAISATQFRDEMKAIQRDAAVAKREVRGPFEDHATDANKQALTAWYDTFDAAKVPGTELVNWDQQGALEEKLFAGFTSEQRRYVDERRKVQHAPEAQWFYNNEKVISDAGYYGASDRGMEQVRSSLPPEIESYSDLVLAQGKAARDGDVATARFLQRLITRVDAVTTRERLRMRRQDPALDKALRDNGRVTTPAVR